VAISTQGLSPDTTRPPRTVRDRGARSIAYLASATSLIALVYFAYRGETLAYTDSISHLQIARRVIDSPTNGLAQLGGVWLPLPHLLTVPLVGVDALYFSGLAGIVVSMAAYVTTSVLLYKTILDLTAHRVAAVAGALVFVLNPNVLYMQSTPMTELLLFACLAGMVYGVQRWVVTDHYRYLVWAGVWGLGGSLTRYEAWVLVFALTLVVAWVAWRRHRTYRRVEGTSLAFLYFAGFGIAAWLLWNQLVFGNPLNFQNGDYAKPSLWVSEDEIAIGSWELSFKTYFFAMVENLGYVLTVALILGLAAMVVRERLALRTLPVLSYATLFAFFVFALEQGQRPLHVLQYGNGLYNVRFGLLTVLPGAVLIGYLVSLVADRWRAREAVAVLVPILLVLQLGRAALAPELRIVSLRDPVESLASSASDAADQVTDFLRWNDDGGLILMESFGNERVLFNAQIPPGRNLYEGSYRMWEPALEDPHEYDVRWIIMRRTDNPDLVYRALHNTAGLDGYRQVYRNSIYFVFREDS
jgi:hypothetical protein